MMSSDVRCWLKVDLYRDNQALYRRNNPVTVTLTMSASGQHLRENPPPYMCCRVVAKSLLTQQETVYPSIDRTAEALGVTREEVYAALGNKIRAVWSDKQGGYFKLSMGLPSYQELIARGREANSRPEIDHIDHNNDRHGEEPRPSWERWLGHREETGVKTVY